MGKKIVSFLVSGRGAIFSAVAKNIISGNINAKIGAVISNKKDAGVHKIASDLGVKSYFLPPGDYKSREEHEHEMVKLLKKHSTDLVIAAGYMRLLTPYFVKKYRNRIINIHPSLLPAFPGKSAQEKAFDYGVKITGCTSHFIDEGIDTGPIILQAVVPVYGDDTLASMSTRIIKKEYEVLSESVKLFCENRLVIKNNRVIIKE